MRVTVNELSYDGGRVTYYLADIYVRDITCFQTALAQDTYGSGYRDSIEDMASVNGALLAVNGDYYGNTNEGVVIRNGVIYRANPTTNDVCVLYYDGTMRVMSGSSFSVDEAIEDGAWQAWTFGPALLDQNGQAISNFSTTGMIARANPRTAIGYYEPGHYCMVVVEAVKLHLTVFQHGGVFLKKRPGVLQLRKNHVAKAPQAHQVHRPRSAEVQFDGRLLFGVPDKCDDLLRVHICPPCVRKFCFSDCLTSAAAAEKEERGDQDDGQNDTGRRNEKQQDGVQKYPDDKQQYPEDRNQHIKLAPVFAGRRTCLRSGRKAYSPIRSSSS